MRGAGRREFAHAAATDVASARSAFRTRGSFGDFTSSATASRLCTPAAYSCAVTGGLGGE